MSSAGAVEARLLLDGDSRGDPILCPGPDCDREFMGTAALKIHVREQHPGVRVGDAPPAPEQSGAEFTCPECGKLCATSRGLGVHRAKHKGQSDGSDSASSSEGAKTEPAQERPAASGGKVPCPSCGKLVAPRGMGLHTARSHGEPPSPAPRESAAVRALTKALERCREEIAATEEHLARLRDVARGLEYAIEAERA